MDIRYAAQVIRDTVDMETVLNHYGFRTKHGKMICPFHGDRNASLQVYPAKNGRGGGWHCFGCGRGGSVIDFVMAQESCSFPTAVKAIDLALGLGLDGNPNMFGRDRRRKEQEKYDRIRASLDAYYDAAGECLEQRIRETDERLLAIRDKAVPDRTADEWTRMMTLPEELQYMEYLREKIQENKQELMIWRNRIRKAKSG